MGRTFNFARQPQGAPNVQSMRVTAAQTFKKGALVVDVAAGTISEFGGGTDASVLGVAGEDAFTKPGNSGMVNAPSIVTGGSANECSLHIADRQTIFSCRAVNGGTDPVTPTQTMIGEQYGVLKVGDDWCLDIAETTTKICEIVDVDIDNKIFFVKFLESVLALP